MFLDFEHRTLPMTHQDGLVHPPQKYPQPVFHDLRNENRQCQMQKYYELIRKSFMQSLNRCFFL